MRNTEFLRQGHFKVILSGDDDRKLIVQELENDGRAEIEIIIQDNSCEALSLNLSGQRCMPFLDKSNSADGHLLVQKKDGERVYWVAHVIESKRTLKTSSLKTAKKQLINSMIRLATISEFFGIEISDWKFWIAYVDDKLSPDKSEDSAVRKQVRENQDNISLEFRSRLLNTKYPIELLNLRLENNVAVGTFDF